ncbi:thioesterase II family protein [Azospirillum rugosum]|uniref:Medium-chain acyl-[acyl-carrier-protein] hydrolase n=1 Tax=Azospirillum rugosum TaxID=416170 RepID=A0ABS4SH75_9PROT|nr:thioesterase domain-containing protein [Azospirillum rugosum]MBP2291307.1 medium-chain acyl-[acyl-carrier-protein] hydrolase [Azospirillum rugosum]MDQ0525095.1 medium-chain acyl-[acyl-carrier-protein] hydrolase [Azospirillum rugosum]
MSPSPWLQSFHTVANPRRTLVCFPHAGAGAAVYRDWHRHLDPRDELVAVRLPGRESRIAEPSLTAVADAVPGIMEALAPRLDRPLLLFGHSLGASLAHATARALVERGAPPRLLAVSGRRAPHLPLRRTHSRTLDEAAFRNRIVALGGTPPEVLACADLMELMLPMLRADFIMSDEVDEPVPTPLPIPMLGFAGTDDAEVSVAEVAAWEAFAGAGFALHRLPGGHFFPHQHCREIVHTIMKDDSHGSRRAITIQ